MCMGIRGSERVVLSCFVACGMLAQVVRAEFETPTAIVNVKIVAEPGMVIESGTILMAEGRIVEVGPEVSVPAHAERIDGTGLIAYPGFIDAHSHLGISDKPRTPEERLRTEDVRPDPKQGALPQTRWADRRGIRPQFRAVELYAPDEKQLEQQRAAGFTVALVAPRDGVFGGKSALFSLSDQPIRRAVLDDDAAMHASFLTGEEGDYPQSLLGIFAEFRQVLLDADWHVKLRKYFERHPATARRPPTDAALDALQPLLARKQRLVFEANTENEIHRALNLAHEFNLDLALSGAREAWKVVNRIQADRVPLIVSLKFDEEPEYGKKKREPGIESPKPDESTGEQKEKGKGKKEKEYEAIELRKERRRLWEEQATNTVRLQEAGVPFALRTRDFKEPEEFWKNLRLVMERGLTEQSAVAAMTSTPAAFLGMGEQLGSIRRGRLAHVTLMSGPLGGEKSEVKYVFIDGKKFEIDKEKLKKRDREGKKDGEPDDGRGASPDGPPDEGASATTPSTTPVVPEEKETSPSWRIETKADRRPKRQTGGNVLITNATIIPVSGPTIPKASILIRGGKIAAIGEIWNPPLDTTVIDAAGRFAIPGIVDCHSHLGVDGVNESPLAISAEVRIADLIDPDDVGLFRAAAGGTTTHHVMHGSANPIGGQNATLKIKYDRPPTEMFIPDAPPTIKFALGENVTQANFPQNLGQRFPNTRMGIEATIRGAFEAAKRYQYELVEAARRTQAGEDVEPLRRDLRLEALAGILAGKLTVHSHCYRSDEILRLFEVAEDYGIRIGTLQHVLEGYRIAPEIARHGSGASSFANTWAYKIEAYQAIPHNAALMTEQGINVSVNSDSDNLIRYLNQEAAKCIKWGGLDENQALRLITLNPAMQLQIDHRVGSIEIGKDGDIAIFNGHPLNTFSKCIMTLIDGEMFFQDTLPDPVEPCAALNIPTKIDRKIPPTPHRAYAIVNATLHPMNGPVIEKGNVVIVEDRIHAVGPGAVPPPGAGVIDGSGLHVYPGLIDAGGNLGLIEVEMSRATRDISDIALFGPHLRTASAIHPHSEHIRIARTAGITTQLTMPTTGGGSRQAGTIIAGQSAVIHLDGWTAAEMLRVDPFGLHVTVPSLPGRMDRLEKEEREKREKEHKDTVRKLEEFMIRAKLYAEAADQFAKDPKFDYERDLALGAMVPYVRGEKPVVFTARTYKQIAETLEFAEKHKLKPILFGAQEAWKVADKLKEKDIAVIVATPLSYPADEFEPWDSVYRCASMLEEAGVRYCFASEEASSAYDLPIQVGMAVAHGLTREKAEFALTLGAARILGIDERVGSIEVGKQADLIITTDTPLQTVSQVTHVFIDGRPIELTSLHTENYEKFKNRPRPKLPPERTDLRGPKSLTIR